jgi:hypothetical protein
MKPVREVKELHEHAKFKMEHPDKHDDSLCYLIGYVDPLYGMTKAQIEAVSKMLEWILR